MDSRRQFLAGAAALMACRPAFVFADDAEAPLVQVWKSPTCGCCSKWVDHLRRAGFEVKAENVPDVNVYKQKYGLPPQLASCHTALVEGYVVEGHVPAADVIRMLKLKPEIAGIAVPAMPMGSPGMESPRPQKFDVVSFTRAGKIEVFSTHTPPYEFV
jgi:hypothetical protein